MRDSRFHTPRSRKSLERLVKNSVQENLHLEYKDSRALGKPPGEIPKDISSMANSDGGVIVYGMTERNHVPVGLDGGVASNEMNRERLEQIITSNIAPKVDCSIVQIPVGTDRYVFVVQVPKSVRGPHQDRVTKRYYKRRNSIAEPMEDYEIADVRARSQTVPHLVRFDAEVRSTNLFFLVVENVGTSAALDVTFTLDKTIPWKRELDRPQILTTGIKYLPPKARYDVFYGVGHEVLGNDAQMPAEFKAIIKYQHAGLGHQIVEQHYIDFRNYLGTWPLASATVEQWRRIEEVLKQIAGTLRRMENALGELATLAGPTGLDLSVQSIRNLRHAVHGEEMVEKLDPTGASPGVFVEVLGVDRDTAYRLRSHFRTGRSVKGLAGVEGVTPELVDALRRCFHVIDEAD